MTPQEPATELDPQFSSEGASATPWSHARDHLELYAEPGGSPVLAFQVRATKAFGFGKGRAFSQTRYQF